MNIPSVNRNSIFVGFIVREAYNMWRIKDTHTALVFTRVKTTIFDFFYGLKRDIVALTTRDIKNDNVRSYTIISIHIIKNGIKAIGSFAVKDDCPVMNTKILCKTGLPSIAFAFPEPIDSPIIRFFFD